MRLLTILLLTFSVHVYAVTDYEKMEIRQRIKPIGQVRIKEDMTKKSDQFASSKKKEAEKPKTTVKTGQKIYEHYCSVCHRSGVAGAPRFRNETDWKPKLAEKGLDGLVSTAIKGINAMPPKGTCMDCSEADIKKAIQYMLPQS